MRTFTLDELSESRKLNPLMSDLRLQDYFAAKALSALIRIRVADFDDFDMDGDIFGTIATRAYEFGQHMLLQRLGDDQSVTNETLLCGETCVYQMQHKDDGEDGLTFVGKIQGCK